MRADFRTIILILKYIMLLKYAFNDHSCLRTIATQTPRVEDELDKVLLLGVINFFFFYLLNSIYWLLLPLNPHIFKIP